ncbi:hypothetical protein J6S88_07725 [bacterium]|nr:hypothetical protein [bacterium]
MKMTVCDICRIDMSLMPISKIKVYRQGFFIDSKIQEVDICEECLNQIAIEVRKSREKLDEKRN